MHYAAFWQSIDNAANCNPTVHTPFWKNWLMYFSLSLGAFWRSGPPVTTWIHSTGWTTCSYAAAVTTSDILLAVVWNSPNCGQSRVTFVSCLNCLRWDVTHNILLFDHLQRIWDDPRGGHWDKHCSDIEMTQTWSLCVIKSSRMK